MDQVDADTIFSKKEFRIILKNNCGNALRVFEQVVFSCLSLLAGVCDMHVESAGYKPPVDYCISVHAIKLRIISNLFDVHTTVLIYRVNY
jgi:hypothetical protein